MKLFRNPVAVSILAVVAVVMVFWRVFLPMFQGFSVRRSPRPNPAAVVSAAKSAAAQANQYVAKLNPLKQTKAAKPEVKSSLDLPTVASSAAHWELAPRRDPFHSRYNSQNRARQLLTLKGIWRQTGSALAVINNHTVAAGDTILEFSVENIEADRVWVVGPNGREALDFKLPAFEPAVALEARQ
jgi:hypothetical protein